GAGGSPDQPTVIFTIKVDKNVNDQPFANIGKLSAIESEEVLFTICTIFRIESVEQYTDELWEIKLKDHFHDNISDKPTLLDLGTIFHLSGEYDRAIKYNQLLLEKLPPNHSKIPTLYNNIGSVHNSQALETRLKLLHENHSSLAITYNNIRSVHKNQGNYVDALNCYDKALEIQLKSLPENHPLLATTYNNIGSMWNNQGNYVEA
ncbi:unnamed protein product, partial [Rotaria sp. Silwood2]